MSTSAGHEEEEEGEAGEGGGTDCRAEEGEQEQGFAAVAIAQSADDGITQELGEAID